MSYFKFENTSVGYNGKAIIKNLNHELVPGDIVSLMGWNGSGKSTMLKSICGLIDLVEGNIVLDNKLISDMSHKEISKKISIVLSSKPEVMFSTVYDIVCLGRSPFLSFLGVLTKEDKEIVDKCLKYFNLEGLINKDFNELSDGQKQRVLMAKSLAQDTPIILFDEPLSYLDIPHKLSTIELIKNIAKELKKIIIFSTHDWPYIKNEDFKVWYINEGESEESSVQSIREAGKFPGPLGTSGAFDLSKLL
jgi:iron complex transport system ATP-binding protein